MTGLTRRDLLATAPAVAAVPALVRPARARPVREPRLVVVVLRGGLDGVAAVPPLGDPDYRRMRGTLAFAEPGEPDGALALDGMFGLHPALAPLARWYGAGELAVLHAVATPYRDRSHFDAQNILETAGERPHGAAGGWLNRALAAMPGSGDHAGLALGLSTPLMLYGDVPVATWAPQEPPPEVEPFLKLAQALYAGDPVFGPALEQGLRIRDLVARQPVVENDSKREGLARMAGQLLAADDGPRVAVLNQGKFDTHAYQGLVDGALATVLAQLAADLVALREGLGGAWRDTVVAVVTEFGRTVRPNGTDGTDHGTGTVAFVAGGAVHGGRVLGAWPGLGPDALLEDRDLMPTTDLRSLYLALLVGHLGLDVARVERDVLPGAPRAPDLDSLFAG